MKPRIRVGMVVAVVSVEEEEEEEQEQEEWGICPEGSFQEQTP
jgi:hypothetical protein